MQMSNNMAAMEGPQSRSRRPPGTIAADVMAAEYGGEDEDDDDDEEYEDDSGCYDDAVVGVISAD